MDLLLICKCLLLFTAHHAKWVASKLATTHLSFSCIRLHAAASHQRGFMHLCFPKQLEYPTCVMKGPLFVNITVCVCVCVCLCVCVSVCVCARTRLPLSSLKPKSYSSFPPSFLLFPPESGLGFREASRARAQRWDKRQRLFTDSTQLNWDLLWVVGGGGSRGYLCASHSKTSFGPFFFYLSPPHPPPPPKKENNNNTSLHLRNTHHPRLFTSQTTCQGHRKVTCHKSTSTGNKVIQVKVGREVNSNTLKKPKKNRR